MSDINPNTNTSAVVETSTRTSKVQEILSHLAAQRNQTITKAEDVKTGVKPVVKAEESAEPEVELETNTDESVSDETLDTEDAPNTVSESESDVQDETGDDDAIDFLVFAKEKPNAKIKFPRNGKMMEITAKKAADILGQGSAIHEDARELKVQKAAFEEESALARNRQRDLLIAMDMVVEPRIKSVEQNLVSNFSRLNQLIELESNAQFANDPPQMALLRSHKDKLIAEIYKDEATIKELRPNVDKFRKERKKQVEEVITRNRQSFKDPELKNKYNFEQLREKLIKDWPNALEEHIPGVPNIEIIMSDESILSLVRDGQKFRNKTPTKSVGASVAQVVRKASSSVSKVPSKVEDLQELRKRSKQGDKKASAQMIEMILKQKAKK